MSFSRTQLAICSSPARAASARRHWPARRRWAGRPRKTRAAGEHRSGLEPGRSVGRVAGQPTDGDPGRAGAVRDEPGPRGRRRASTASGWSARIAACLPDAVVPAWKSSFPAPAPWRSRLSTSSRGCWPIRTRPPSSITWCSTPRRPGTPCGCCRCPRRGAVSSTRTPAGRRAWARWPDCRRSISCTRTPCRPCPTRKRRRWCW
jgi:hypothetical protein